MNISRLRQVFRGNGTHGKPVKTVGQSQNKEGGPEAQQDNFRCIGVGGRGRSVNPLALLPQMTA